MKFKDILTNYLSIILDDTSFSKFRLLSFRLFTVGKFQTNKTEEKIITVKTYVDIQNQTIQAKALQYKAYGDFLYVYQVLIKENTLSSYCYLYVYRNLNV